MNISVDGPARFVATERALKPVRLTVECIDSLAAGSDVRVSISTRHSYDPSWKLNGVEVKGGTGRIVLGHGLPQDWTESSRGGVSPAGGGLIGRPVGEVYLCTLQVTQAIEAGAALVFEFELNSSPFAGIQGDLLVKVRDPDAEAFKQVGDPVTLHNTPGPPTRLELRANATPDERGQIEMVVYATDDLLNPAAGQARKLSVSADGVIEGLPPEIELSVNDEPHRTRGLIVTPRARPARIQVKDAQNGLSARSGPILSASSRERKHYFGGIHFHTRLSVDGDRDPRAAYAYARDTLKLDVVAMTDHAPIGLAWQEALAVNEEFYEAGRFVTVPAWESSNAYGHANLYLRTPDVHGGPWLWNPQVNPSEVEWPDDVVMVPHHTNAGQIIPRGEHWQALRRNLYWAKYDWSIPNPRARLVEVMQGRGNFEADALDDEWGIRMGEQGASVQDALAAGWRLGFVAGTDNHNGHPTQRDGEYVGLTCFRAPELTRESIWQAMDQRHTYATSGVPIVCDFWVNGTPAGQETVWQLGDDVHFSARLHGTAPIERIEIISQGRVVWHDQPQAWDVEVENVALPAPDGAWAWYYLRLRQTDGHRAWLSPVWLDRVD